MYTDDNGIVRFESLDNIAPLQVGLNAAMESVSDALDTVRDELTQQIQEIVDPPWQNLQIASGFIAGGDRPQYRIIGSKVELRGQFTKSSGNIASGDVMAINVPPPAQTATYIAAGIGTGAMKLVVENFSGAGNSIRSVSEGIGRVTSYVRIDGMVYYI